MNKSLIKKYLDSTFLMEESKPKGLTATEKVQKDSGKENKAAMKDVEKKMKDFTKMDGEKENAEVVKKYNYSDKQAELHDVGELQKGSMAALEVNGDTEEWDERQKKAIEGDSTMGNANKGDDVANVVPGDQAGFQGPEGNEKVYDDAQKFKKKRLEVEAGNVRKSLRISGADFDDEEIKKSGPKNESKMKRLVFKNEFKGVENALKMIPESYKVDNKTFQMTDGNENYEIRWEGSLNEGRAIVLKASDKQLMNEDMNKMKHLMGYKSQETLGNLKGAERINEDKSFNDIWGKTKNLLNEADYSDLDRKTVKASGKEQYRTGAKVNSQALAKELEYVAGKLSDEADKGILKKAYNATSVKPEVEEMDIFNQIRKDLDSGSEEAKYAISGAFQRAYYLH
jgi:hypothetical protein